MSLVEWLQAIRIKTLGACVGPAMVSSALSIAGGGSTAWIPFIACIPAAFLVQIGTNLINDALDFVRGADTKARLGPKRLTQSGAVSSTVVYLAGLVCFALSFVFIAPAVLIRGKIFAGLVASCCAAGYAYTGGPYPLAYHGLGDVGVFLFFGIVATALMRFVHQGGALFGKDTVVAGMQVGLMAVNMLAVNNLRDIATDKIAKKLTLAVQLGYETARWQVVVESLLAYALGFWWLVRGPALAFYLPLFGSLPLAYLVTGKIFATKPCALYNKYLAMCGVLHLLFSLLLAVGLATSERGMD